jgi:hypothetical protein
MQLTGPSCPARLEQPKAQSPFAHLWRYLRWCDVWHHIGERYLSFFAHMDSCASPTPSACLWSTPWSGGLCRLRSAPAGHGTFPTLFCKSVSMCLDPYPGCSWSAFARFFPQDFGLPYVRTRSALHGFSGLATSLRTLYRGCSHSLRFRPTDLLATPVAPTAVPPSP